MEEKQKRLEENLEKLEENRQKKLMRKELDNELKFLSLERTHRTVEYQAQLRIEKLRLEDDKLADLKKQTQAYRTAKNTFRQQLVDDINLLKAGEMDIGVLKNRFEESLDQETLALSLGPADSKLQSSRKSFFTESPKKKAIRMSQFYRRYC